MDFNKTRGYNVRIFHARPRHNKFFSTNKYGSWESALQKAEEYQIEFLIKHPKPHFTQFKNQTKINNTSGINGVHRTQDRDRHTKKIRFYWAASYTKNNQRKTQKFYIDVHGESKAKQEAIEFRKMFEKEELSPKTILQQMEKAMAC